MNTAVEKGIENIKIDRLKNIPPNQILIDLLRQLDRDIESYIETLEILNSPEEMKDLKESIKDIKEGRYSVMKTEKDMDDFFGSLKNDGDRVIR